MTRENATRVRRLLSCLTATKVRHGPVFFEPGKLEEMAFPRHGDAENQIAGLVPSFCTTFKFSESSALS